MITVEYSMFFYPHLYTSPHLSFTLLKVIPELSSSVSTRDWKRRNPWSSPYDHEVPLAFEH